MMWTVLFSCLCVFLLETHAAKILGVFMSPSHSHQVVFQPIWKELSLRGHQVTVYTPSPLKDASLTNLTEYDLTFSYKIAKKVSNFENKLSPDEDATNVIAYFNKLAEAQLNHIYLQDLIKNVNNETYDLVLLEYMWHPYFAFKEIYKVPAVGIISFPITAVMADALGMEKHPVTDPELFLDFSVAETFKQRLASWSFTWIYRFIYYTKFVKLFDDQKSKYFGKDIKSTRQLVKEIDVILSSDNVVLDVARARSPNFVPMGPIHVQPPKPLPKDLGDYLDNIKTDVIYFSLGTNVQSSRVAKEHLDLIFEVLGRLPYTILYKTEVDQLPDNLPRNFYPRSWYPQQDLLAHPKIKLFIMQGGRQSIDEALLRKVPMLIVPFFADQKFNAHKCVQKVIAESVNIYDFTREEIETKLYKLLNNPIYKENLEKYASIIIDQPLSPIDTAVYWIEHVLKHKGAPHLRVKTTELPFYQYYLLDVYLFCLVVLSVFLFVTKKVVYAIGRRILANVKKEKTL